MKQRIILLCSLLALTNSAAFVSCLFAQDEQEFAFIQNEHELGESNNDFICNPVVLTPEEVAAEAELLAAKVAEQYTLSLQEQDNEEVSTEHAVQQDIGTSQSSDDPLDQLLEDIDLDDLSLENNKPSLSDGVGILLAYLKMQVSDARTSVKNHILAHKKSYLGGGAAAAAFVSILVAAKLLSSRYKKSGN